MNLQTVVEDVKGRVELLSTHGQKVAEISIGSLKQAGEIVAGTFQTLVSDNTSAAKEIYSAALTGFEKAKADGLKAIATKPVSYLPTTDLVVGPFQNTVTVVSKSGDKLYRVAKTSLTTIQAQLSGKPAAVDKAVKTARTGARKAGTSAKKTARKLSR